MIGNRVPVYAPVYAHAYAHAYAPAYAHVQATTRALYSTLLTRETYYALVHAPDLDSVLTLLAKTPYASHLAIERRLLTPRRVAYQIRLRLAADYGKLISLTPLPGRTLLLHLWRLYEVDNLKAVLRGVTTGAPWDQILRLLHPLNRYTALSLELLERMARAGDVRRAIEGTRNTPYYLTLQHAYSRYQAEKNLFPLEVALDLDYRRDVWQSIQALKGADREMALHLVGGVLDMDNLLWSIRYRIYHQLSEQEIINYTLPFGYRVRDADIRAIAGDMTDDHQAITAVLARLYPRIPGLREWSQNWREHLLEMEMVLLHQMDDRCRALFCGNPFHIGVPVAYLLLLEHEIRHVTAIVESKAAHLPEETVRFFLGLATD